MERSTVVFAEKREGKIRQRGKTQVHGEEEGEQQWEGMTEMVDTKVEGKGVVAQQSGGGGDVGNLRRRRRRDGCT